MPRKVVRKRSEAMHARLKASGDSDKVLAGGLGMAANTFRKNISRARESIVKCLARHGIDLEEVWR